MSRALALLTVAAFAGTASADPPADLIVHRAKVLTVDAKFSVAQAVAVRDGKVAAVGSDADVLRLKGPKTRVIDAAGKTVLPGLCDSHTHPYAAALANAAGEPPLLRSIEEVLAHVRREADRLPRGKWIVIRYAFPTRLKEARFPTRAELDQAAPDHPVLYHAGPAGVVNSAALKASGVTKDTPDPANGRIVRNAAGEPTGMLRNAYGVLTGVPREGDRLSGNEKLAALKKMFAAYNAEGLTAVADRNGSRDALDAYLALRKSGELTVRVNVARSFDPGGPAGELGGKLDDLIGPNKDGGPTGVGDEWVRVGPIKLFLDGGMLNGTAYMRQPWPKGATYQVTEDDYRGLLFIDPERLKAVVAAAAGRGWQVTAHAAGEAAMDVLLDAYEFADRTTPLKAKRFCITHANFPSAVNLERCRDLGVCADVQPAWLFKDGATLLRELGPDRMRWFQPYKSWLDHTTVGGGSDHMLRSDPLDATNPFSPWLGMAVAVTRATERGDPREPGEALTREQAVRLYTINNAFLHREEKERGSLEVGKLGDLIVVDRDVLTCPAADIRRTRVQVTVVGGRVVYER